MDDKQKILEILKNIDKYNGFNLTPSNTAETITENRELIARIAKTASEYEVISEVNNSIEEDSIDSNEVINKLNLNKLKFTTKYNGIKYIITLSENAIVDNQEVNGGIIIEYDLEENGIKKHYTSKKIEYDFDVIAPTILNILNCDKNSNLLRMNENNLCIIDILLRNIKDKDRQRLLEEFINIIGRSKELN